MSAIINFQLLKWKNFLSTGNAFTEIPLNTDPTVLIIGENGSGKSTLLDALTFSLFGKPFRKINKPGLVNSINKKNCLVEIEFSTNNKQYKVIRGIKPNIFEIWCDGVCLNQDSTTKDYQDYLEKFVLRMNYKSFTQIVILGSASFVPFMQLSPADRRTVIEDLLDIQIFSVMSTIVKQRQQSNREALEKNRIESIGKEEKKNFIEKTIVSLKQNNEERMNELTFQCDDYEQTIEELLAETNALDHKKTTLVDKVLEIPSLQKRLNQFVSLQAKLETKSNKVEKDIHFYCDNSDCPTCRQPIDEKFRETAVDEAKGLKVEYDSAIMKIAENIKDLSKKMDGLNKVSDEIRKLESEISGKKAQVASLYKMLKTTQNEMKKLQNSDRLLIDSQNELVNILKEIADHSNEKNMLVDERTYIETASNLLKDGGIKTKIIKQYLPLINKMINKYLQQMGFFVGFNINENFEEVIKSRYRDEFSYENFSEGEKFRIDLCLLLAWRAVAKVKNSVNTNLLIFDEIFDSSLDVNGTDEFLKIMWGLVNDTKVFVISHKTEALADKFKKTYRFSKVQNFSKVNVV